MRNPVDFGAFAGAAASLPASDHVHGPVGGLNLRFGGGDGGLRFRRARPARWRGIGFGLLLRLAGGGLRGGVSRVARGVGLGGTGLVGRGERGLGHARLVRLAYFDGGLERAQSNLGGTQLETSSILSTRVHVRLVGPQGSPGHLVGGDRVDDRSRRSWGWTIVEARLRRRTRGVRPRTGASGRPTGRVTRNGILVTVRSPTWRNPAAFFRRRMARLPKGIR